MQRCENLFKKPPYVHTMYYLSILKKLKMNLFILHISDIFGT